MKYNCRKYIDLILKASSKWATLEPYQKRLEVGDYGIVNRETGEFEYDNNIYRDPKILHKFPELATEPDCQPCDATEIEKWIIVAESTKQTDANLNPSFNVPNLADASIKVKFSFKAGTRGAFLVMCRPQSVDLPKDVLSKLSTLKELDKKYLITGVVSCPAYSLYLSDKNSSNVHVAFVGKFPIPTTASGSAGASASGGWICDNKSGFYQEGCNPDGIPHYKPLYTMKQIKIKGWLNPFRDSPDPPSEGAESWRDAEAPWTSLDDEGEEEEFTDEVVDEVDNE